MSTTGAHWAELGADDVLLALRSAGPGAQSGFLDAHQWIPLAGSKDVVQDGGHAHAQLRRAAVGTAAAAACWTVAREQLPAEAASARQLRAYLHRAGAEDSSIGDIVLGEHASLAAVPELDLADLLPGALRVQNWIDPVVKSENATVSALRLDAVIAPLFRVSRGEAQTAIEYGFVFQNFAPARKRTATIAQGDQLVFRTEGRIEVVECSATTRSGRIALSFKRYPI